MFVNHYPFHTAAILTQHVLEYSSHIHLMLYAFSGIYKRDKNLKVRRNSEQKGILVKCMSSALIFICIYLFVFIFTLQNDVFCCKILKIVVFYFVRISIFLQEFKDQTNLKLTVFFNTSIRLIRILKIPLQFYANSKILPRLSSIKIGNNLTLIS